ncbi:MAG: ArgP/LysG family DNA-binding transcriptional regulator [Chlamydiae bacterium]|nr:ArgP/LysG family DNA-binding transcriptional regulator [Chlamydiota bacterium]
MIDYRAIEVLYAVHELQSFEAAAKKLHITQSAVSQRIKGLEAHYGEPVLIRIQPYRLTKLGKQLIGHFKRVYLLEEDLKEEFGIAVATQHISIALNRDSIETWFLDLLEETDIFNNVILEIIADDQELTLDYLKNGLVSACLSTSEKEIARGKIHFLGNMEYVLAASPEFVKKYFPKGNNPKKNLQNAPAIKFDQKDKLHERFLEKFFDLDGKELTYHIVPSVKGFKKFALLEYGYGLIPKMDIHDELKKKQLVEIYGDKVWKIPLYWHYWDVQSKFYQKFNADIIHFVTTKLKSLQ